MSASPKKSFVIFAMHALAIGVFILSQQGIYRVQAAQLSQDAGPAVGASIDLTSWRDRNGRTLAEVNAGHSLALVAFITSNCDACLKTKDDMAALRERAGKANIAYYVLMIPNGAEPQSSFAYADSLKIDAEVFVWSNSETKPPVSLITLPAPFHLMLTKEGLVVNKWAGIPSSVSSQ